MATVLLLRHARTTANADGTLAGRSAVGLDAGGLEQAAAVGERLRGIPVAEVVTSPLKRCRQTIATALPGVRAHIDSALVECGYGDWEGQKLKMLAKEPLWRVVQSHPAAVTFPGGESMAAMSARAVATVRAWDERVTTTHGPGAIWLACSHADVIKAIVADALGMHLDLFQRLVVDPASVTVIRYTPGRPFLVRLNDSGSGLATLAPARRSRGRGPRHTVSDAVVGGGGGQE